MILPIARSHPLWLAPHRPFFLLAGIWAVLTPIVWLLPEGLGPEPVAWHRHEMLFGMGGAAMGGYLLTALPAWTQDGPVSPSTTRLLVVLWLIGRLAFMVDLQAAVAAAAMASYFMLLGGFLLRQVLRAKAWWRLPLAFAPLVLGSIELALPLAGDFVGEAGNMRLLPLLFTLLISLVGGRALTAFTIHWAEREGGGHGVFDPRWVIRGATLALVAAIGGLVFGTREVAGLLALASGVLHLGCLLAWRSWRAFGYPALLLLHLAWFWLGLGLVFVGLSLLFPEILDMATALHALTMGAMGSMMLAIMGRAAMARCGMRLLVSTELAFGFGLVFLSVPIRLSAPLFAGQGQFPMLEIAALAWMAGWALFLLNFRHALQGPVRRPVLSAARA